MSIVVLLRHGRTTANSSGVLAGWLPDVALDDTGASQARSVGERLAATGVPIARVVASPLLRCQQTAQSVCDELADAAPDLETHEGLGECRYGTWTGRPLAELAKEPLWKEIQSRPSTVTFPDSPEFPGVSMLGMQERAVAALREINAQVGEQDIVVAVSHGDVIKSLIAWSLDLPFDKFQRIHVDPASVTVIALGEEPRLLRANDTGSTFDVLKLPAPTGEAAVGGGGGATS